MLLPFMVGLRRAMRRHQGARPATRLPLWRLLLGELWWAVRQLVGAPWTLGGLLFGAVGSFAVLSSAAPGPVLALGWRILVATAVGYLVAAAARGMHVARTGPASGPDGERRLRPLTGAGILAGAVAAVVLLVWLGIWVITHLP